MSDQQVKAIIDTLDMDSDGKIEWVASLMADRWLRREERPICTSRSGCCGVAQAVGG